MFLHHGSIEELLKLLSGFYLNGCLIYRIINALYHNDIQTHFTEAVVIPSFTYSNNAP